MGQLPQQLELPSSNGIPEENRGFRALSAEDKWNGLPVIPAGLSPTLFTPKDTEALVFRIQQTCISTLTLTDISALGVECEIGLHKSLGSFIDRIDTAQSPQIFRLVSDLNTAIKSEDLDGLADEIIRERTPFWTRLLGTLSSKNLAARRAGAFENLRLVVAGKARKLSGLIEQMERQVETEKQKAVAEAQNLERLKDNYRQRFFEFVTTTVFLATLLAKAREELDQMTLAHTQGTYSGATTLQEAQDKVQALENRALAIEGVLTKLPAEQLVIREIQTAALQTVQETTTTTAGRFASIKMTLLTLHAAMQVQNLQRTAQQGADLDLNLSRVRDRLSKQVVSSAANAPGENRLLQAQQIKAVTQNIGELVAIVDKARAENALKFAQARATLAQARSELTSLGAVIRPDQPLRT